MNTLKFYDEAANLFYGNKEILGYPISSLDLFAQYFGELCSNLQDLNLLSEMAETSKWNYEPHYKKEMLDKNHIVVVTDNKLNIVFASQNIYTMNGYRPSEVIGRKPKMFQGVKTNMQTSREVSLAVKDKRPFEVTLLNYRKDGSEYNCWIKGAPIFNNKGKLVNFIAFEKQVA